ncbi:MAG TPA: hypothetical protein VNO81_00810 [Candidatus Nitrosotenuis sp.]|jgi:hypothetical protein|nr:hypothetical protein [Candidatus Nitrosotenuis sp.]
MTSAQMAPDFTLEDPRGNTVTLSGRKGRLVVLVFASQATQEAARLATRNLGRALLDDPRVDMWTIVSVPKMFKAMAMGMLKEVQQKALDSARRRFEQEGREAPADLAERIFILPDWDGKLVSLYGFDPKARHVHVALVAPDGSVPERLSSADGEKLAEVAAAKARALLG